MTRYFSADSSQISARLHQYRSEQSHTSYLPPFWSFLPKLYQMIIELVGRLADSLRPELRGINVEIAVKRHADYALVDKLTLWVTEVVS